MYVDIVMLADKLSSNFQKIHHYKEKVDFNLHHAVFGMGKEFNFSLGLLLARMLSQGSSTEEQSIISTDFYYQRALSVNPLLSRGGLAHGQKSGNR